MALVASVGTFGADLAGAATSSPDLVLTSSSIPRGGSTTFTSTFTMDEGTAQATLNNLGTELTRTFEAVCTAPAGFTCAVNPATGEITLADAVAAVATGVNVTISGSINASHDFPLSSTEGVVAMGTATVPDVSITLNQGGGAGNDRTSAPQAVSITTGSGDAVVEIETTAPAAGGVNAGRGTNLAFTALLKRSGETNQVTAGTATLVPDGAPLGTPSAPVPFSWAANVMPDIPVNFTVAIPADIPTGGTGTYRIVVTYDPNAANGATTDTETGTSRSFTVATGPSDAIVTLDITAPANGVDIARGGSVDYTVDLNRGGNTAQQSIVRLSLVATTPPLGTTPAAPIDVFFGSGVTSQSRTMAVTVPAGATLGTAGYRFEAVYDPTGTGPAAEQVDTAVSLARTFDIILGQPTVDLTPNTPSAGTFINRSTPSTPSTMDLVATLTNPAGGQELLTGNMTVEIPDGMAITVGGTIVAPDAAAPTPTVIPAAPGVSPLKVTVNYGPIPAGASRTVTIPVTVLSTATKKPGADLTVAAKFVSTTTGATIFSDVSEFELRADADLRMIVTRPSATEELDPDQVSVPVTYAVENLGPDPAAGVKFVLTPPAGFVGTVDPDENGGDWACTNTTAGPTPAPITCTYQPALLNSGVTTTAVDITWTFNTIGAKVFSATASSNTFDPVLANNTPVAADVTTTISKPTAAVTITAAASPDPVVVASDDPAEVSVTYTITNTGPKNIKAQITVAPPAGATLLTLSNVGTCTVALPTTSSTTCSLGTLQKPTPTGSTPTTLLVVATYSVPQSVFLASGAPYTATLEASIAPVDGGTFGAGSVTTASDTVTGSKADLRMNVSAPATAQLNPSDDFPNGRVEVPVEYTVTNLGPQGAATVTFTATAPAGQAAIEVTPVEANLPGGGNPGPAWVCTDIASGGTTTTCTYQGNPLASGATTPKVTITWTLETAGEKTFAATASTTTLDTNLANNTPDPPATTTIESPLGEVRITATATPDPAPVAIDADATVSVTYSITNAGPGNVRAEITLAPPAGATLTQLTNVGSCTVALPTMGSTTCSLGNLQKPTPPGSDPTAKAVVATYTVPKSVFLASALYQAGFSATIAPTNGGSFGTPCADPANPTPGCSINSASDTVTGTAPIIDIGLDAVSVPALVNVDDDAALPTVPRTMTYQNWSTTLVVRPGKAFIEFTIPAAPTPSIGIPAECTVPTALANVVRCPVAGEIAKATGAGPGTATLTLNIPLQTAVNVPIEVRAVVDDPTNEIEDPGFPPTAAANRVAANVVTTPDTRAFDLDLNRRPSVTTDIGPGVPAGGTFTAFPIPLHNDDDGDLMKVATPTPSISCGAAPANCAVTGGSAENLSVTTAADRVTVSHTGSTPTDPAVPVTVEVSYLVDDEKGVDSSGTPSSSTSKLRFKLLPAMAESVEGSFGDRPENNPTSFGIVVTDEQLGPVPSDIPVLVDERGTDADGGDFPDVDTYAISNVEPTLVTGSSAAAGPAANPNVIVYTPARGFTSDPPSGGAPADSFRYTAKGMRGADTIFEVVSTATIEVPNQDPIGVDLELVVVPNTGPSNKDPLVNDIDGNTVSAPIDVDGTDFTFDDKNSLQILCIGPYPTPAQLAAGPVDEPCTNEPGMVLPGADLTVRAIDDSGAITARVATATSTEAGTVANRTVTITPDASVADRVPFAAVIVDSFGGTAFSPIDVVVTNQPPEVIAGVPAVPKNSPPTEVIDTVDAGRDNNGDLVVISGFTQPEHGTVFVKDQTILMYEPERDYVGPDSLILEVSDSRGTGSNQAQLNIDVVETASQPTATDAGSGAGAGAGAAPAGPLPATGGDPLALTVGGAASLLVGFLLLQASRRRQSLPLLAGARHLRT